MLEKGGNLNSQENLKNPIPAISLLFKSPKTKKRLTKSGMILYEPDSALTIRFNRKETEAILGKIPWHKLDDFCEVVHLEISGKCNLHCGYCYAENNQELPTQEWKRIIKDLKDYGVLQVSFGGGEPLLRDDVFEIAQYCNELGLNVTMTTNGTLVRNFSKNLYRLFKQVNVSWQGRDDIWQTLHYLKGSTALGINFIMHKRYISDLKLVVRKTKETDAELLLLAYKPVKGDFENVAAPVRVYKIAEKLHFQGVKVAIDGPCLGFCLAAKRFCDVHSNGDLSVCSFVREPIGNLTEKSFKEIWRLRPKEVKCPYFKVLGGQYF
jgi:MoaA/NifB/PqqE/SkfB family radical SAM enzyme